MLVFIAPALPADKTRIATPVQQCLTAQGQAVAYWEAEIDDRDFIGVSTHPENSKTAVVSAIFEYIWIMAGRTFRERTSRRTARTRKTGNVNKLQIFQGEP